MANGGGITKLPFEHDIKFIRAGYGRSAAVTNYGHVFVWGRNFKGEAVKKPRLLFQDKNGVDDLKFGLKHAIYQQTNNKCLYSWGDHTVGQTGNKFNDITEQNLTEEALPTHLDWQGSGPEPEYMQIQQTMLQRRINRRFSTSKTL